MLALKKLVVWFTLVCFVVTMTGCATSPYPLTADTRDNFSLTPDEQANANQAYQVFNSPHRESPSSMTLTIRAKPRHYAIISSK